MTDQKLFCDAYFDLKETKNDQSKGDQPQKVGRFCFLII